MHNFQAEDFWQFSCAFYAQPAVKQRCLALQDQHGFNINLLLLCCYLHTLGWQLSKPQLHALRLALQVTDVKLAPLRAHRRTQSKNSEKYQALLKQELQIEKQQQLALIQSINSMQLKAYTAKD